MPKPLFSKKMKTLQIQEKKYANIARNAGKEIGCEKFKRRKNSAVHDRYHRLFTFLWTWGTLRRGPGHSIVMREMPEVTRRASSRLKHTSHGPWDGRRLLLRTRGEGPAGTHTMGVRGTIPRGEVSRGPQKNGCKKNIFSQKKGQKTDAGKVPCRCSKQKSLRGKEWALTTREGGASNNAKKKCVVLGTGGNTRGNGLFKRACNDYSGGTGQQASEPH